MSADIYFQTMQAIAQSLHEVPDDTLPSQLQTFQMFIGLCGERYRDRAVALLNDAADRATDAGRKRLLIDAARLAASGTPIAEAPEIPRATAADWDAMVQADPSLAGPPLLHLTPWDMFPGLAVRIGTTFTARGDTFTEGEILHFTELDFLPYHEGYTFHFEEKTIYLCGLVPDDGGPLDNGGNQYFEPYPSLRCLKACCKLIKDQWAAMDREEVEGARSIEEELERCDRWLNTSGRRGLVPFCSMGEAARHQFHDAQGIDEGLGFRIAFLFTGIALCPDAN